MLHAGKLRERVTVQAMTESQDSESGAVVETWADAAVEPMGFEPLQVREPLADGTPAALGQARFTRRYRSDRVLSPKTHRLVHGGRVYDIKGVQDVVPRETVVIIAEARAE